MAATGDKGTKAAILRFITLCVPNCGRDENLSSRANGINIFRNPVVRDFLPASGGSGHKYMIMKTLKEMIKSVTVDPATLRYYEAWHQDYLSYPPEERHSLPQPVLPIQVIYIMVPFCVRAINTALRIAYNMTSSIVLYRVRPVKNWGASCRCALPGMHGEHGVFGQIKTAEASQTPIDRGSWEAIVIQHLDAAWVCRDRLVVDADRQPNQVDIDSLLGATSQGTAVFLGGAGDLESLMYYLHPGRQDTWPVQTAPGEVCEYYGPREELGKWKSRMLGEFSTVAEDGPLL